MRTIRKDFRKLPVPLTPSEIQVAGVELGKAFDAVLVEKEAQKATKSMLKDRLDNLNEALYKAARKVNRHEEDRPVTVNIILDEETSEITEVRADSGEVVVRRSATPEELQAHFEGEHRKEVENIEKSGSIEGEEDEEE